MIMTIDLVTGEVTSDVVKTTGSQSERNWTERPSAPTLDVVLTVYKPDLIKSRFPEGLAHRDIDVFLNEMRS